MARWFDNEISKDDISSWNSPVSKKTSCASTTIPTENDTDEQEIPDNRDPFHMMNVAGVDYDALEHADFLEKGLSREIVTEFVTPVFSTDTLRRFNVLVSEDLSEFRLLSETYVFKLLARVRLQAGRVDIFQYDPNDDGGHYDPCRPAFTLVFNSTRTDWRLLQERCENCQFCPKHVSCSCQGKPQVAAVRHFKKSLGGGRTNCMEVTIPGLRCDGSPVLCCPRLKNSILSPASNLSNDNSAKEKQVLSTRCPTWNEEFQCLVLDFAGRSVTPSPYNFQLAAQMETSNDIVCQYGKIGKDMFSLDFKQPLSMVQAFGIALSTRFLV